MFLLLGLTACAKDMLSTGQDFEVKLVGTEEAYCIISTIDNRYSLNAPGSTYIERDDENLKIDCRDNYSDRRRVMNVDPYFGLGYYNYPATVTVDFATLENGTRYNGYQGETNAGVPVITENSFSAPIVTVQTYPVQKTYTMGRRPMPLPLK